jgi:hypothetical protein
VPPRDLMRGRILPMKEHIGDSSTGPGSTWYLYCLISPATSSLQTRSSHCATHDEECSSALKCRSDQVGE